MSFKSFSVGQPFGKILLSSGHTGPLSYHTSMPSVSVSGFFITADYICLMLEVVWLFQEFRGVFFSKLERFFKSKDKKKWVDTDVGEVGHLYIVTTSYYTIQKI